MWKRKRTIEKAKILNCDSEEAKSKSFLHFAFQPFQVFGSRLLASFFLHLRKQEGGRVVKALDITIRMSTPLWVRSSCVSRFPGTFSSSGFRRFSRLKYRAPPTRLVTLREPHICKTVVHFAVGKLAFKFTIPSHWRCEFNLRLG